jgi:hypothetical protein
MNNEEILNIFIEYCEKRDINKLKSHYFIYIGGQQHRFDYPCRRYMCKNCSYRMHILDRDERNIIENKYIQLNFKGLLSCEETIIKEIII